MIYTEERDAVVDVLDLTYESFDETVDLYGVTVEGDADVRCVSADNHFRIPQARVGGQFYGGNLEADVFNASRSRFEQDFYLNGADIAYNMILRDTWVEGVTNINRADLGSAFIQNSTFEDGLSFKDTECDGTVFLENVKAPFVDLRGFTGSLKVDDLDRYTFLVGDSLSKEGWIGEVTETDADPVSLTEKERNWYEQILERPKFPLHKQDSHVFTVDDLRRDYVMDEERQGLLGSLTQKGVFHRVDDDYYIARSDVL